MKPGRELDALVAEKVMGLEVRTTYRRGEYVYPWPGGGLAEVKNYSTDIASAWEIFEKFNSETHGIELFSTTFSSQENREFRRGWVCQINGSQFVSVQDSAPHAICLVALEALGFKQ